MVQQLTIRIPRSKTKHDDSSINHQEPRSNQLLDALIAAQDKKVRPLISALEGAAANVCASAMAGFSFETGSMTWRPMVS